MPHRRPLPTRKRRIARSALYLVAGLLLWAGLTGCEKPREPIRLSGTAQGTTYSVTVMNPPEGVTRAGLTSRLQTLLAQIDAQMSSWREDSEISRFNKAPAGEWVSVSPELAQLTAQALELARRTEGAFDVTLAPVLAVWGFGPKAEVPARLPTADELAAAREQTGVGHIDVRRDPPALRKTEAGVKLDLAGLAQGYSVDRMAAVLDELGADRYLVELGGELYARGNKKGRTPWRIGVEKPKAGAREIERVIGLSDAGMTTSGDYRDFFEIEGRRFSHTIDPRTGRPVAHELRAVTVVAKDSMTADAMATALLVMGPRAGLQYANAQGLAALFVSGSAGAYDESYSKAFEPYLKDPK